MSTRYKATVNGDFEFDITHEQLLQLDAISTKENVYHILDQNNSYTAEIQASQFIRKTYQVKVNSNIYEVVISDQVDLLINDMGFTIGSSKDQNDLISPMPGLIIDVQVTAGQKVKEGDLLVILSAMKMENSFVAHRDGVVKAVHVQKEDAVDKGELLVEFEEEN